MAPVAGFKHDVEAYGDAQRKCGLPSHTLAGVGTQQGRFSTQGRGATTVTGARTLAGAARGEAQVPGRCRTCGLPRAQCRCAEADIADAGDESDAGDVAGVANDGPSFGSNSDAGACHCG